MLPVLAALLCLVALPARAGEEEDAYRVLMRQYEAANAELDHLIREMDCPSPVAPTAERLLSARKNTVLTVGGEMRVDYVASRGKAVNPDRDDPFYADGRLDETHLNDFDLTTARLVVDARSRRWRGHFDFNLNGYSGYQQIDHVYNPNAPGDPGANYRRRRPDMYVNEAYVEMLKESHSGLGFKVGLVKMPFGLEARPELIGRSFLDAPNLTGSYLNRPYNATDAVVLPHASRLLDPAVAALINYELRDIIRFEAGIFQERSGNRIYNLGDRDYANLHNEAEYPLSHQVGVSILPLEGWELSLTYRNRFSRTRGVRAWSNSPYRSDFRQNWATGDSDPSWDAATGQWADNGGGPGFGSRRNEQAFTAGIAVEIPNTRLAVQLEYAHGWNQGFNKYIKSDNVNLGLTYRLTPFLTLFGQAEWLHVKDRSWMAQTSPGTWQRDTRNNRLYRFLIGAEYELMRGLTLEAGWQYEYWNYSSSIGDGAGSIERTLTANMGYLGTRFVF